MAKREKKTPEPKTLEPKAPVHPKYIKYSIAELNKILAVLGERCTFNQVRDVIEFFEKTGQPVCDNCNRGGTDATS